MTYLLEAELTYLEQHSSSSDVLRLVATVRGLQRDLLEQETRHAAQLLEFHERAMKAESALKQALQQSAPSESKVLLG